MVSDYKNKRKSLNSLQNDVDTTEDKRLIRHLLYLKLESFKKKTYRSKYKKITYVDLSKQFGNKFHSVNLNFNHTKFNKKIDDGEVDVKVEIFKSVMGYMDSQNIKKMYYFDDDAKMIDKNTKIVTRFFPAMVGWCNNTTSADNGFIYKEKYIELIVFDYQIISNANPNVDLCYVNNKEEKCERVEPPEEEELCNIELRF